MSEPTGRMPRSRGTRGAGERDRKSRTCFDLRSDRELCKSDSVAWRRCGEGGGWPRGEREKRPDCNMVNVVFFCPLFRGANGSVFVLIHSVSTIEWGSGGGVVGDESARCAFADCGLLFV